MASETRVEICDFGQAMVFSDPGLEIQSLKGKKTRPFELYTREKIDVTKVDVFGLGVIAALLFTEPQNHANLVREISMLNPFSENLGHFIKTNGKVKRLILQMLETSPQKRPSAAEVAEKVNMHADFHEHDISQIAQAALDRIGVDSNYEIFRDFTDSAEKVSF